MHDPLNLANSAIKCSNRDEFIKILNSLENLGYFFNIPKEQFYENTVDDYLGILIDKDAIVRYRISTEGYYTTNPFDKLSKLTNAYKYFDNPIKVTTFEESIRIEEILKFIMEDDDD